MSKSPENAVSFKAKSFQGAVLITEVNTPDGKLKLPSSTHGQMVIEADMLWSKGDMVSLHLQTQVTDSGEVIYSK